MALSYDAAVWRQLAQRARELADRLGNPALSAPITRVAMGFEVLAERVDRLQSKQAVRSDHPSPSKKAETPRSDPPT